MSIDEHEGNDLNRVTSEEVPETSEDTSEEVYEPQDEWEEKALKMHWNPNHVGENFVDAKTFVMRKPLFDKIEGQNKELRKLREQNRVVQEHMIKLRQEAYDQALRNIESQREQAFADLDSQRAKTLDLQYRNVEQQRSKDPIVNQVMEAPAEVVNHEVTNFLTKVSKDWYNGNSAENAQMKLYADEVDKTIAQAVGMDTVRANPILHLQKIENAVRDKYSHRFNVQDREESQMSDDNKPSRPAVAKSTVTTNRAVKPNNLASKMSDQQKQLAAECNKRNPKITPELYAEQLNLMGILGK